MQLLRRQSANRCPGQVLRKCNVQVLVNDMQQKLGTLDAEASAARDRARQLEAKASSLESEKALLATAEQRLTRMINELSAEKHKLMAQSQVEHKVR